MATLAMVRHGQSEYNLKNLFTGWIDAPLTEKGIQEARETGQLLKNSDFNPDVVYTSELIRAQKTMDLILEEMSLTGKCPIHKNIALNERNYGDLGGLNKAETAEKYGAEQVHIWRRSFDIPPPGGESLKDTADRALPYFEEKIVSDLKEGKNVLVVAHGNSLRAIVMRVEKLSPEEIVKFEIKTGEALFYDYNSEEVFQSRQK